ncbi:MAG: ATPase, partial [Burkholderiales bacterium]|nr:ATPase [Burkholderiales bacterium]
DAGSITTVTLEERDGRTLLVMREVYPTKEALDEAGTGAQDATHETFAQLDELLAELAAR